GADHRRPRRTSPRQARRGGGQPALHRHRAWSRVPRTGPGGPPPPPPLPRRGREMSTRWRPRGIAVRIALLSLLVTAVAVSVIAIGVLGVAQATFNRLMLQAGQSADTARAMFDHSVLPVFIVAATIAVAVSALLASLLAIRLAGPLDGIARAARQVAR